MEHGSEGAGETKILSTSSGVGVWRPPDTTSVVLAKPQLKLQGAPEDMHVEVGLGRNGAPVVRVANFDLGEKCSITVSRLGVFSGTDSLPGGGPPLWETLGWTQL